MLKLSKKYGSDRPEAACGKALPKLSVPRCRRLKAIPDSGLDREPDPEPSRWGGQPRGHMRGADYYRDQKDGGAR